MFKSRNDYINKLHLIISVVIVIPVAFVYGYFPDSYFELFPNTIDEHSFYKAIMGLYLGFSVLWILGVVNQEYLRLALITNIIFMLGLGFGRVISVLTDGWPTFGYVFGTVAELLLGFYGVWVLKRFNSSIESKKL